jgi:hypothetical protein
MRQMTHEGIGMFDDLSPEQFEAVIAQLYSDNIEDLFETSGTSPTCKSGKHLKTAETFSPRHGCRLCQKERLVIPEVQARIKARQADYRAKHKNPAKPMVTETCAVCITSFETNQPRKLYCSEKCSRRAKHLRDHPPITKTCVECGTSFDTSRSVQKFCSQQCKKNAKEQRRFERNPVRVKALRNAAKKRLEKKVKATVLAHYGNHCSWPNCTETSGLHFHHILLNGEQQREEVGKADKFYAWVKRNAMPKTLQLLCPAHHRRHHWQVRQIAKINPSVPRPLLSWVLTKYREHQKQSVVQTPVAA